MPKKTPRNAFFYYMLDVKRREELTGRRFAGGLAEVSLFASPQWQQMSAHERGPFEKQAKRAKNNAPDGEVYTSQGIPYSQVERARNEVVTAEAQMKRDIDDMVQHSYQNNTIADQPYYFIATNHFCRTLCDNRFFPAELACLRYTLADGYTARFHSFCNPGSLPAGYAFEALEHSQAQHGLPPPPSARGCSDYAHLMRDLVAFISAGEPANSGAQLPPLFTDVRLLPAVRSIVAQLCEAAGRPVQSVRIFPLVRLFHVLKREALRYGLDELDGAFASEHVAQALLDRDRYDLRDEIACAFHQEADRSRYCALSVVTRYAFALSDHICMDLGIDLVLGRHVPEDSDVAAAQQQRTEMVAVRQFAKSRNIVTEDDEEEEEEAVDDNDDEENDDDETTEHPDESETDNTKYESGSIYDDGQSYADASIYGMAGVSMMNASSSVLAAAPAPTASAAAAAASVSAAFTTLNDTAYTQSNYTQYQSNQSGLSLAPSSLLSTSNMWLRRDWPKPRAPANETFELALQKAKQLGRTVGGGTGAGSGPGAGGASLQNATMMTNETIKSNGGTTARTNATMTTTFDMSTVSSSAASAASERTFDTSLAATTSLNISTSSEATIARMLENKLKIGWGRGRLA